jgi:8-oxo-dGTP diphosphatase
MRYTPILATLGYVMSPDKKHVLMVHRNARPDDHHHGKYNGLGGKVEQTEDVVTGMCREIYEESQIEVTSLTMRGTINWPFFGKHGEDWFGFIFRIDAWSGTPLTHNPEGTLEWIPVQEVTQLDLWPGDTLFLPMVFQDHPRQFHGAMIYEQGKPAHWTYTTVE